MSVHDKAKWHFEGNYPEDLPITQAYVHIGYFLGWAVDRGFEGDLLKVEFAQELADYRARKISGPRLLQITDGVLDDQMLSPECDSFASDCYSDAYMAAYGDCFDRLPSLYHVTDTPENFAKVSTRLDAIYAKWKEQDN